MDEDERSAGAIRDALLAILQQPRYRVAARRVAAEMAALPPFTTASA